MIYQVYDIELNISKQVEAPGIVEAMYEYLPWPCVDIEVRYSPVGGRASVVDKMTKFLYELTW